MCVPTFIVGTGRCGSTMLSNMLREHPRVLSLSEFFAFLVDAGARIPEAFDPRPMDGRQFWSIVSAHYPSTSFSYRHRIPCDEQLYPYEAPGARFTSQTGVPAILVTTLPHLTDDHERLFEALRDEVAAWPEANMGQHYTHLFDWLAAHFGKSLWIERSGAALHMLEHYCATFPAGRYVHLARDGRDAAISIQGHLGMRLYFIMSTLTQFLGVDPITSGDRANIDRVPEAWRPFLPERFDADVFRAFRIPMSVCAAFWTHQVEAGVKLLERLPQDRLLTLRYEDFVADPKRQIDTLAGFLGEDYIDDDWSARCAAAVRPPHSTWRDLPEGEALELTEACQRGFDALRAAGVEYDL